MKLIQKILRQHIPWSFIKKGVLQGLTASQIISIEKMNSAFDIEASKQKWMEEEDKIKQKIVCFEDSESDLQISLPFTVGGADLSYIPDNDQEAVCCYVVMEYRTDDQVVPDIIWKDLKVVDLNLPYIPGLLAFREAHPVIDMIRHQMETSPEQTPDYLMIDGNGINHPRKCGMACHIGVKLDLPTIGVAKNLFSLEHYFQQDLHNPKECRDSLKKQIAEKLILPGDSIELLHPEDKSLLGLALKVSEKATKPCFISVGHKISLGRARAITLRTSKYKNPDPTRMADLLGREYIRTKLKPKTEDIEKRITQDDDLRN